MMVLLTIWLTCILQPLAGFGVLRLCNIKAKPGILWPLSILTGIAVMSVVPFILQLLFVPLTVFTIYTSLPATAFLLNLPVKKSLQYIKQALAGRVKVELYEIPFLLVTLLIVFVSVWRCYYMPPTPRDLNSGAEVIAEYAVREHTMINSVFTVNLESTNNPYKPPFVTCLQIIYKLAGFTFGQVWLSIIFVSFIVLLYNILAIRLHKILAGILLISFVAIPEMFAYTFMVLFDYANAVYFFVSIYFLIAYFENRQRGYIIFAALCMGFATYTRNETLVLAAMMAPAILLNNIKARQGIKSLWPVFFWVPSLVCYVVCVTIYLNHYLPVKYNVTELVNTHLLNLQPLWERFRDMNVELIFSKTGITYYAYFIFLFLALFVAELIVKRRFSREAKNWLYAILVVYAGLPILGYLLPLMDLDNTTKRGLFKIFPLMLLYMGNNSLLVNLSRRISLWENATPVPLP